MLLVRAADLPRLHDPDAGRDALPRMLARAHEGQANAVGSGHAGGDAGADRDQRGRVPDRDGGRRPARAVAAAGRCGFTACCSGRRSRPPAPPASARTNTGAWSPRGFLHDGLLHIFINMISLWFVGSALEPAIGRVNFLAVYFVSLLAGSFGALWFQPMSPTVGASGRDLRDLRRADRGRAQPGHPDLAERARDRARVQPGVLAQRPWYLGRRPPRRAGRRPDHRLADRRGRRAPAHGAARRSSAAR